MKITQIEVMIIKIPLLSEQEQKQARFDAAKHYISDSYYVLNDVLGVIYSDMRETVLVRIDTDEGVCGWGEALAPTNPEVTATLIKSALAPVLIGENPLENQKLFYKMLNMFRVRGYTGGFLLDAIAALDIAFWDIKGKLFSQPVYKLLGGAVRDKVPVYMSYISGNTKEEKLACIEKYVSENNKAIKLHTVGATWRDVSTMLAEIRKRYSPEKLLLMHDGHWRYSFGEAVRLGQRIDDLDMEFFECPLTPEDLEGHKKLAQKVKTPIAVGESMRTTYEFNPWIASGAAGVIQPDIGRMGITEMMRIALVAETNGVQVAPHVSVHQMIGIAASIHVSYAMSNFTLLEFQPQSLEAAKKYAAPNFKLSDGMLEISDAPGLGIEINQNDLKKFITEKQLITGA